MALELRMNNVGYVQSCRFANITNWFFAVLVAVAAVLT